MEGGKKEVRVSARTMLIHEIHGRPYSGAFVVCDLPPSEDPSSFTPMAVSLTEKSTSDNSRIVVHTQGIGDLVLVVEDVEGVEVPSRGVSGVANYTVQFESAQSVPRLDDRNASPLIVAHRGCVLADV
ncbi:hypothetical protein Pmani_018950 [Petrolisthes manimaculis]|uniref:Uncharacterized protein n=1 Tax=Petrolisthes manimaculis TaxID=1843537 RepID=A0AAE1U403_9EUCA|nr:hypothetical protein Pmani_018950 [Petrolisthes manimaculis]